jgi:hypothetical protein
LLRHVARLLGGLGLLRTVGLLRSAVLLRLRELPVLLLRRVLLLLLLLLLRCILLGLGKSSLRIPLPRILLRLLLALESLGKADAERNPRTQSQTCAKTSTAAKSGAAQTEASAAFE